MNIKTIQPSVFSEDSIRAFFTLRNDQINGEDQQINGLNLGYNTAEGPEIITQNRKRLFDSFEIDHSWIAFANQVHCNRVKMVTSGGIFAETDGLITQVPGLALAIQVADCAAVLLADTKSKTIAAVHAGWRGAVGDIVPRALDKMKQLSVKINTCQAFISPCISLENFEVGWEVADQFPSSFIDDTTYAKPHVNLKACLKSQLQASGLKESSIEVAPGCTMKDDQFYSYRRQKGQSGRMMAVIQLKTA